MSLTLSNAVFEMEGKWRNENKPQRPLRGKTTASREARTISGYFRQVFKENPKWLEGRSNDEVLARWLKDHPGENGSAQAGQAEPFQREE